MIGGDRYDYVWSEALGDAEGDLQDTYTRHVASGWYERAMREAKERGWYQPIVRCRQCATRWAPAPAGSCAPCRDERWERVNREIQEAATRRRDEP